MVNRQRQFKRIKQDYQRQNLQNPFFRKKGKSPRWLRWLWFAIILAAVFLVWFFLAAPVWRFDNLRVTGLSRTSQTEVKKIIWDQSVSRRGLFFKQSNIFLFDRTIATEGIKTAFNLAAVVINKKLPRTLEIKISERPYAFIFQENGDSFHASADAFIIKEPPVAAEELKKYPILENMNEGTLVDASGRLAMSSSYLIFFFDLSSRLTAAVSELTPEKFIIDQEFNMMTVKFVGGPAVYFNVRDSAASQIERLLLVKREKIKDNFSRTSYIDLRYGDRIFVNPDFSE